MNLSKKISLCFFPLLVFLNVEVSAQIKWDFTTSSGFNIPLGLNVSSVSQTNNNGTTTFLNATLPESSGYIDASGGNNANFSAYSGALNISTSTYMQVVFTPDTNNVVEITNIQLAYYSIATSGPTSIKIYSSLDSFSSPLKSFNIQQDSTWAVLSTPLLLRGNLNQNVTLRIYASGGTGSSPISGAVNWLLDDLEIQAVAKPLTERVYISMKYSGSPSAPTPWNNISNTNSNSLLNDSGTVTNVGIEFLNTSWVAGDAGAVTGNNSGVYPDAVIKDYFWFGAYGNPETINTNLKGLDTSSLYNIIIFGSSAWRGLGNNGTTIYTINNIQKPLYVDSNKTNTVTFQAIKPNAAGVINLFMSKGSSTPYGLINAIVLEKMVGATALFSWVSNGNVVKEEKKIGTIDSFDLPIITNNIEKMRITKGGSVGIGTSSPNKNAKLDVNGNIFTNGKIIIGTNNLSNSDFISKMGAYSLAVNGTGIFNKIKVKQYSEWADYVFEPDYKLPTLSYVAKFIAQHKHLPEMPSADEVKLNGIDIGEQQTLLLKKIEELTLYIIEINKKVEELTKENEVIKQKQITSPNLN